MDPKQVRTVEDARAIVEERNLSHVRVGLFDVDGVLRGKYMSREKFFSALDDGFGFCDVVVGWDVDDQLYDNVKYTGWHTGYPDATARLVPETCRELQYEENGLLFLAELGGPAEQICPRGLLRRVIETAGGMGYEPLAALEYEFFLFDEKPHAVHDKGFRNLRPVTPGNFGYSMLRSAVWSDFHQELLSCASKMDFDLEGLHTETGPGVLEAAITVDGALRSADKAALFKTWSKVVAEKNDLMATFMAKWSPDHPGQSGHLHISLKSMEGDPLFHDESASTRMSTTMGHFVAGCRQLLPEMLVMSAPTVNSYRRLIPGYWAPTNATWGIDNRTCALRVIAQSKKGARLEYRIAGADANPYLTTAAALASGLHGIEHKLDSGEPVTGNAYDEAPREGLALPGTLMEAAKKFRESEVARKYFGDAFVEHFAATREWEEREFRKHISDWELKRYFEII